MALFRKKSPQIVRKSSTEGTVEERKTVRVKGRKVEVTRVEGRPAPTRNPKKATSLRARVEAATGAGTVYPLRGPGRAAPWTTR
jgi:hypothetical protein